MKSPIRMIDLTGHLKDLRGSLSPDCRHFEPAPPHWQSAPRPDAEAQTWSMRLFIAFLLINAVIIAAYLAARQ